MFNDVYYEDKNFVLEILSRKDLYLIFEISECTLEKLNEKCEFILSKQSIEWKPLKLIYKHNVHTYIKTFYIKR